MTMKMATQTLYFLRLNTEKDQIMPSQNPSPRKIALDSTHSNEIYLKLTKGNNAI